MSRSTRATAYAVLFLFFNSCYGVIYHLNESEYHRMPPLYALDDFGLCMVPDNGTYCLANVDLVAEPGNQLMQLIQEYSAADVKHYNHSYLTYGVCLTSTCQDYIQNSSIHSTDGLTAILERCLNASIYEGYGIQARLSELAYCEKKTREYDIDTTDWVVLGVFASIVLINFVGTLYDLVTSRMVRDTKGNKYLMSFSLIQNWNRIMSKESEEIKAKRLTGLHGARVLTMFLMFTSHVIWINSMGFIDNIQDFEEMYESPYYQMIYSGTVIVQLFLVMSGFLLVYNLEDYAAKNNVSWKLLPKILFLRWIRVTPAYAILLAFHASWLRHLGSGPLWRFFVTDEVTRDCRRYWWTHLLYVNNYVITHGNYCALQSWYLAVDTQVFCLGLLTYFLARHGGKKILLGLLLIIGTVLPAVHVWALDLDAILLMKPEIFRAFVSDTFFFMHALGHNNIAAYVIGMATGYFVFWMQKKKIDISNNKLYIALAWLVLPFMGATFYSGSVFYSDGAVFPVWSRDLWASLQRPIFSAVVAFGLIALAMQFKTVLRSFFEAGFWLIPSRLSYSVYLLHMFPIHAYIGLKTQLAHASTYNLVVFHLGMVMFTFMMALPFCLLVESPLLRLTRGAEPPKNRNKTEQTKF